MQSCTALAYHEATEGQTQEALGEARPVEEPRKVRHHDGTLRLHTSKTDAFRIGRQFAMWLVCT
jgi:hypothetical protein